MPHALTLHANFHPTLTFKISVMVSQIKSNFEWGFNSLCVASGCVYEQMNRVIYWRKPLIHMGGEIGPYILVKYWKILSEFLLYLLFCTKVKSCELKFRLLPLAPGLAFYLRPKATQMYEHRCPSGRLSVCTNFLTTFPMSDYHEIGREGVSWKK